MSIVLLHLSDIHIKTANDPILSRGKKIAACVFSSLPSASWVFIVVSGDIAYSGESEQYAIASKFLREIQACIQEETKASVSFVVVPGNHDCDFSQNSGARKMLVKSIETSDAPDIDPSVVDQCTSIQIPFFEFRHSLEDDVKAVRQQNMWVNSGCVGGRATVG
jgi:DNA repair exonuclease SbcCD nuclease subunit